LANIILGVVFQALAVIIQILKYTSNCNVYIIAWERFLKVFVNRTGTVAMNSMLLGTEDQALVTAILLHWTQEEPWTSSTSAWNICEHTIQPP
jgi:hypothetical protein